jgi:hypothetical protein
MMNQPYLVGEFLDQSSQKKMCSIALETLVIREFFNDELWIFRTNPGMAIVRETLIHLCIERNCYKIPIPREKTTCKKKTQEYRQKQAEIQFAA